MKSVTAKRRKLGSGIWKILFFCFCCSLFTVPCSRLLSWAETVSISIDAPTQQTVVEKQSISVTPEVVTATAEINTIGTETLTIGEPGPQGIPGSTTAGEGGGTWGSITGTLADQTDLQAALDGKAPAAHDQAISTITGLQTALDAKAAAADLAADHISYTNPTYTTVAAALDQLLYLAPSILTHTNRITYGSAAPYNQNVSSTASANTIEIGNTVSRVELFWTLNKSVTTQSIAYTGGSIGSIDAALRAYDHTGQAATSSRTYTLTVGDGTNTDNTPTTGINIYHKRYWGVSSNTTLTDGQIIALTSEFATDNPKGTISAPISFSPAGQYIYYAYPSAWGGTTANMFMNGLPMTDWQLTTRTFVNASGNSTSFHIWRTTNLLNGSYTWYMS